MELILLKKRPRKKEKKMELILVILGQSVPEKHISTRWKIILYGFKFF